MKRARLADESAVPTPDALPDLRPGHLVELDGRRIFVRRTPARRQPAAPALFVHGLGGSSANWTDLAELLADRLDGEAVDLPGFGRSDPAASYTVAAMGTGIGRWIEAGGRGPVHLIANSMGGAACVHLAATRPELVRTLTLISPAMPFLDPRRSVQARFVPLLLLPNAGRLAARRMAAVDPLEMVTMVVGTCYAEPARFPSQRIVEAADEARLRAEQPWYGDAYVRSMRGLVASFLRSYLPGSGSLWRMARRVAAPTLVVAGVRDRLVDVRVAPRVARLIPDSRLLLLDNVGHVAQMEAPRAVARAVLGMLDDVTPAAGADVAG